MKTLPAARRFDSTAASVRASSATNAVVADGGTSLAWIEIHDQSPASYGISTQYGYVEMIPFGTTLPCTAIREIRDVV